VTLVRESSFELLPGIEQHCIMYNNIVHPLNDNKLVKSETLAYVVSTGICTAIGVKLANACSPPEKVLMIDIQQLGASTLLLPKTTLQLIDLIGYVDDEDCKVRVSDAYETSIIMLLKALHFACKDEEFINFASWSTSERDHLKRLSEIPCFAFNELIVAEVTPPKKVHLIGQQLFKKYVREPKTLTLPGKVMNVCPPRLIEYTLNGFLQWYNKLLDDWKEDHLLVCSALMACIPYDWLSYPNRPLKCLDDRLRQNVLVNYTVVQLLLKLGCYISNLYITDWQGMFVYFRKMIAYYFKWVPILKGIYQMAELGRSEKGNIAQLVQTCADDLEIRYSRMIQGFPSVKCLKENARHIECVKKLTEPSAVLTSACFALSKNVVNVAEYYATSITSMGDIATRLVNASLRPPEDED
jgi:hypothetical protein